MEKIKFQINSASRLRGAETSAATFRTRKALAFSLLEELNTVLSGCSVNNLDCSLSCKCELSHVVSALKHLGFKPDSESSVFTRPDMIVHVNLPYKEWHPVLTIL